MYFTDEPNALGTGYHLLEQLEEEEEEEKKGGEGGARGEILESQFKYCSLTQALAYFLRPRRRPP